MKSGGVRVRERSFLERRFSFLNKVGLFQVWVSLIGIGICLVLIVRFFSFFDSRVPLFLTVPLIIASAFPYLSVFALNFEKLSKVETKRIGNYRTYRIVELVQLVIRENFSDKDEIPTVYIGSNLGANAFAINSLFLNFSNRLNSITLSRDLFERLTLNEIKAVIAHEIGHFKKNIYIANRIPFISLFFVVLGSYVFSAVLFPDAKGMYFFVFFLFKWVWSRSSHICLHDVEYLSDLYAAEKYGKLETINGLIKLYQMNDFEFLISYEISRLMKKSNCLEIKEFDALKRKVKKVVGQKFYDRDLVSSKTECILKIADQKKKKTLSSLAKSKRNRSLDIYLKSLDKMQEQPVLDWDRLDSHQRDGRIDEEEYDGLIELLQNNPELPLFRGRTDNVRKMRFCSHPALRQRILFIDQNCE